MAGRSPDYFLAALNKATDDKNNRIGAAWEEDDGSIAIKLDHFVHLQGDQNLLLKLFPNKRPKPSTPSFIPTTGVHSTKDISKSDDPTEDEIPF